MEHYWLLMGLMYWRNCWNLPHFSQCLVFPWLSKISLFSSHHTTPTFLRKFLITNKYSNNEQHCIQYLQYAIKYCVPCTVTQILNLKIQQLYNTVPSTTVAEQSLQKTNHHGLLEGESVEDFRSKLANLPAKFIWAIAKTSGFCLKQRFVDKLHERNVKKTYSK